MIKDDFELAVAMSYHRDHWDRLTEVNPEFEERLWDYYAYDRWPSGAPYDWSPAGRGDNEYDNADFHVDLGCGKLKKGRIGIDHFDAPGVDIVMDLNRLAMPCREDHLERRHRWFELGRLPFATDSIESIVSHHCLEHVGDGFLRLMDECYRVLKPGGIFRIIVPLFPSWSAVSDPDHRRYFMAEDGGPSTFDSLCGTPDNCWLESFSVPYTKARFEKVHQDLTPEPEDPVDRWTSRDARELRVALKAMK